MRFARQRFLALGFLSIFVSSAGLSPGCYESASGPKLADDVSVPISISHHGQPRVSVALSGESAEVLVAVDTGSTVTALDLELLAERGIPVDTDHSSVAIGFGGQATISESIVPDFRLGGFSVGPIHVSAIDMSAKRRAEVAAGDRATVGVVGMDLLARLGAVIDLKRNHVLISRGSLRRQAVRVRGVVGVTGGECSPGIQPLGTPVTPVGNARVTVTDAAGIAHEARSDSSGRFELGAIRLGILRDESIAASADGLSGFSIRPIGRVLESASGELLIVLCAQ
jgi:hypothetical protein